MYSEIVLQGNLFLSKKMLNFSKVTVVCIKQFFV